MEHNNQNFQYSEIKNNISFMPQYGQHSITKSIERDFLVEWEEQIIFDWYYKRVAHIKEDNIGKVIHA